jgi:hypothetical protein
MEEIVQLGHSYVSMINQKLMSWCHKSCVLFGVINRPMGLTILEQRIKLNKGLVSYFKKHGIITLKKHVWM